MDGLPVAADSAGHEQGRQQRRSPPRPRRWTRRRPLALAAEVPLPLPPSPTARPWPSAPQRPGPVVGARAGLWRTCLGPPPVSEGPSRPGGGEAEQAPRPPRPPRGRPVHRRLLRPPQRALRRVPLLLPRLPPQPAHRLRERRALVGLDRPAVAP